MGRSTAAEARPAKGAGALRLLVAAIGVAAPLMASAAADPTAGVQQSTAINTVSSGAAGASVQTGPVASAQNPTTAQNLTAAQTSSAAQSSGATQASPSVAQNQPPAPPAGQPVTTPLQEVVVTGSHIATSTFSTPTPVTVIDSKTIESLGLIDAGDIVNQMPANSNFTSSANIGLGNFYIGAQFANLRGLDPFFGTRTLTLVNSERFVPTAAGGQVDLNVIPSIMIDRTETVTGGASAAYGSDAVAGVVNIILNNKFQGLKVQVDGGETTYSDGGDMHVAAMWGSALLDGRFHNVLAAEYEDAQGIGTCGEVRPWCQAAPAEFTNTGYAGAAATATTPAVPPNGLPHYIIGGNGTSLYPYTGDLQAFTTPLIGFPPGYLGQFNAAGTALVPFNPGTYYAGAGAFTASQGGNGPNYYDNVTIRPPVIHWSLYNHSSFDFTDTLTASLDVSFAERRATNTQGSDGPGGFPVDVVYPYNAYLSPAVAAEMGGPAWFAANTTNDVQLVNSTDNYVGRIVLGLTGSLLANWKWDGYYEYGENGSRERLAGDTVEDLALSPALTGIYPSTTPPTYDFLGWSLDAVTNPATGQIVCAATLPTLFGKANPAYSPYAAGCVPINLFGSGNASQAALNYIFRTLHQDSAFTQNVFSWSTHGDLFSGWGAGPIEGAIGAEYRHNMADVTHDMADQPWYSQYLLSYGGDYSGTIDVVEGFTEFNVPFLKDLPGARNLSLDIALRESDYKNSNTTPTGISTSYDFPSWKFSLLYDPVDWLRLRADRSRDTRAPSFYELWAQTTSSGGLFGSVVNPWVNPPGSPEYGVAVDPAKVVSGGYSASIGLRPEEADTTTLGFVLTPTDALEGFQLSTDWYQIIVTDAIAEIGGSIGGGSTLVDLCYNGYRYYCQFIGGVPNGTGGFSDITSVNNYNLNLGSYTVRGYDFELDYRLPFDRFASGRPDSLDFRVLTTYQYDQIISPGFGVPTYNYAGVTGPTGAFGDFNTLPKWQGNAFMTYTNAAFTGVLQARVIGSGKYGEIDTNTGLPLLGPGQAGYSTTYPASINNNSVGGAVYWNLTLTYTLPFFNENGRSLQVFGVLDNIFNRFPPVAPGGNGYPTNPVYFDTYGRTWKAGVRLQL